MTQERRIYHITHVDNLAGIVENGGLLSDAVRLARGYEPHEVGMSRIKARRLELPVPPHPGTCVGDYVPFYFCPRSIMLYVIHRANHPDLTYRGGQGPIVHLSAGLDGVIDWAERTGRRWAFSFSNAGAFYSRFSAVRGEFDELNWQAVASTDFRDQTVKEVKQAEFLAYEFFPFSLFDSLVVMSQSIAARAHAALEVSEHTPSIRVRRDWYY